MGQKAGDLSSRSGLESAPTVVSGPEDIVWNDVADVVVVGFGGAGVAAAIEAAQHKGDVIAVDRFGGGGATAFSGGIIYAGGGTSVQRDAGVEDTTDDMEAYLQLEVGNVVGSATVKRFCQESPETVEWLKSLGVAFEGTPFLQKTGYPPDGFYLYYSGNEAIAPYKIAARPALRGHRPVGDGMGGVHLFSALRKAAEHVGVRLYTHSPAISLVVDENGAVLGVEVLRLDAAAQRAHQQAYDKVVPMRPFMHRVIERQRRNSRAIEEAARDRIFIRAKRGVVLSTGGFVNNIDLLSHHSPDHKANYPAMLRMGSLGCDGSGIELGRTVGGQLGLADRTMVARNLSPPASFLDGIIVNRNGERFVNEGSYSGHIGRAIEAQPGGEAWLILSATSMRTAIKEMVTSGWLLFKFSGPSLLNILFGGTRRGSTIEKLAAKCGIEVRALKEAVSVYNISVEQGIPDHLEKSSQSMRSLGAGPFYAVNFKAANRWCFNMVFTLGGLVVDEDTGQVRREDGQPIAGLYAAGRAAVGICSNYYVSGLSIGDAIFAGRRAARHAMSRLGQTALGYDGGH